jgi:hypothetical protein
VHLPSLYPYCAAGPDFYDEPQRLPDAATRFAVADLPVPPGWQQTADGFWISLRPACAPAGGWRLTVSVTLGEAERVCRVVRDYCVRRELPLKMLRSRAAARFLNGRYADPADSGRLLTVYPGDAVLEQTLTELAALLEGLEGPGVPGDLRFRDTVVSVQREQPGESVPEVLRPDHERRLAGDQDAVFPYEVVGTVRSWNGSAVHRARDVRTGARVVLREARRHAGLGAGEEDAVARLEREAAVLLKLQGLPCVPRLIGRRRAWGRHYLIEQEVAGETLAEAMPRRHPGADPDPRDETRAAYADWVLTVTTRLEWALEAVHARGVRLGELHPGSVLVRPDGEICLVGFAQAGLLDDAAPPGLPDGSYGPEPTRPSFTAPEGLSGVAADRYLLDCLRLWMLMPLDVRPAGEPHRVVALVRGAEELFPLPEQWGPALLRGLRPERPPAEPDRAGALLAGQWPAIRESLVAGLRAMATPERADRLFPGDPEQFATGGAGLAYGAAGVLHALHQAGAEVPEAHVDWLVRSARRDPRPGLYTGSHGVAGVLHELGRTEEALDLLERVAPLEAGVTRPGLFDGRAGIALALLHFARRTGDAGLLIRARWATDGLASRHRPGGPGGLLTGLPGLALLHLHLYEDDGDPAQLDHAAEALHAEAARGSHRPNGSFQLADGGHYRLGLGDGSSGLAMVARHYLRHRGDPELAAVVAGVLAGSRGALVRSPGLFSGRAGLIATQAALGGEPERVREQVRRLVWHARTYRGQLAFPGRGLLRLSADLGTGAAGVLAALTSALDGSGPVLPYLDPRQAALFGGSA